MVDMTVFGWSWEASYHVELEYWDDYTLARDYPNDMTNPLNLARLAAEREQAAQSNQTATVVTTIPVVTHAANVAHTTPVTAHGVLIPAIPPQATISPHTPPVGETNIPVAIPVAPRAEPTINANTSQAGPAVWHAGPAPYGPWRNYPDFPMSLVTSMSKELLEIQEKYISSSVDDQRITLAYNKGVNLLYHLLPGEMLVIARGVPYCANYSIAGLREKISRAGRHMGATLRLVVHEDRFEIGRLN